MNKKVYILFLGFILSFGLFSSVFSQAPTETLTITTYYPSPYGSYKQLSVTESGAQTTTNYALYLTNTATSSTASINKYGMYISSTGTWNGVSANNYGLYIGSPTGGTNNYGMVVAGGNVGIGLTNPGQRLVVSDGVAPDAYCDGNNWVNASSREAKEDIRKFSEDDYRRIISELKQIDPVWYRYRGAQDKRLRAGLIAEDMPEELATPDKKGISTADAIGFLMAVVKAHQDEIERLKAQLKSRSK